MEAFINKWQTLIGSALGVLLAIILSLVGFLIKSVIESKKERKEFLRRIEIGITRSLEDTYKTRQELQIFVARLRSLITEIRDATEACQFDFTSINYPMMPDIHRDIDAPNFKVKNYYLHNKLLFADAGIKKINETVTGFKNNFAELQRKNELLIILMCQNQTPNPDHQRREYVASLGSFANAMDEFMSRFIKQGIEIMAQIKIYNEHLRKKYGHCFLWNCEGTKFKYFRNKTEQRAFARNLDSLERIDKTIQKEVELAIAGAEQRGGKLAQENISK